MQARDFLLLALRAMKNGLHERKKDIGLINRQDLAHSGPLLSVLESPTLFSMMTQLMVSTSSCSTMHLTGSSMMTCHTLKYAVQG